MPIVDQEAASPRGDAPEADQRLDAQVALREPVGLYVGWVHVSFFRQRGDVGCLKRSRYHTSRQGAVVQLYSSTRNGASTSTLLFKRRVGRGSLMHCLSGNAGTAATISSAVSGLNSSS